MNRPLTLDRLEALWGCPVFDRDNEKVGSLEDVFEEGENREPGWLGIGTGLLGRRLVVVPGRGAIEIHNGVRVAYLCEDVQQAPELRHDELDEQTIRTLEAYYAPLTEPKQRAVLSSAG